MNKKLQSSIIHYSELAPGYVINPGAALTNGGKNEKRKN